MTDIYVTYMSCYAYHYYMSSTSFTFKTQICDTYLTIICPLYFTYNFDIYVQYSFFFVRAITMFNFLPEVNSHQIQDFKGKETTISQLFLTAIVKFPDFSLIFLFLSNSLIFPFREFFFIIFPVFPVFQSPWPPCFSRTRRWPMLVCVHLATNVTK